MKKVLSSFVFLYALTAPHSVNAQGGPSGGSGVPIQRDTITVGLGVGVTTSYDGARDYKLIPGGALLGTLGGHDFRLNGPQLFVDAIPNNAQRKIDIEFGPVAGVHFNRTGDVSDNKVEALGTLNTAVEIGARASVGMRGLLDKTDKLALAVTGVKDIAKAHRSYIISPAVEYSRLIGRQTFMRLSLTSDFVGKKWASYNFGIDAAGAAASGLAVHNPNGGLASIGGSILAIHSLGAKRTGWSLFGVTNYRRLQDDIAASPIVRDTGSPNQFFASFGLAYSF